MRGSGNLRLLNPGTAFVGAAAAALVAGGVIADRLGAPGDLIATLVFLIALAALATAGLSFRTMRPSVYYAGGRMVGRAGVAAITLCLTFAVAPQPSAASGLLAPGALFAACAGALLYGALAAAPLRRAGGLTFADAIDGRFGSPILAFVAGATALTLALALAAMLGPAAVVALQKATGIGPGSARAIVAASAGLALFTGGYAGIAAVAATATVIFVLGWAAPATPLLLGEAAARTEVLVRAAEIFAVVELNPASLGLALSYIGLLVVLGPALASNTDHAARSGPALGAVVLITAAFLGTIATISAGKKAESLAGLTVQQLPATLYADAFRGQVKICGVDPTTMDDVQRACARAGVSGPLPPEAFQIFNPEGGRWLAASLGLPAAAGAAFALAAPFLLIVAFATACHGAATALNHDLIRRFVIRRSTASGALALQRILVLTLIAAALLAPIRMLEQDGRIVRLLYFVSASIPLPLLLIGLWRRADWRAALCGIASACLAGAGVWYGYLEGNLLFLAGAASGLIAGLLAALIFPARDARNREAADVMIGRVEGPIVLDQGA